MIVTEATARLQNTKEESSDLEGVENIKAKLAKLNAKNSNIMLTSLGTYKSTANGLQDRFDRAKSDAKLVKSSLFGTMPLKQYRHILHPGSKLMVGGLYDSVGITETMKADFNKDLPAVQEDYKISKVKHLHIINPVKFVQRSSTGPAENRHLEFLRKNPRVVKMAVLTIERYWKGYKCRKEYRFKMKIKHKLREEELADKLQKELIDRELKAKNRHVDDSEHNNYNRLSEITSPKIMRQNINLKRLQSSVQSFVPSNFGPTFQEYVSERNTFDSALSPCPQPHPPLPQVSTKVQKIIMRACRNNNLLELELLIVKIYPNDVNAVDLVHCTPLFYAAKYGNKSLCQYLFEKGAKVNIICQEGNTALHMAFLSGSRDVYYSHLDGSTSYFQKSQP